MKPSIYPSRDCDRTVSFVLWSSKEKNQTIAQNKKTDDAPF